MPRLSIRDLFWATLVIALGLGWWCHYRSVDANRRAVVQHAQKLKEVLTTAKGLCGQLEDDFNRASSFIRDQSGTGEITPDIGELLGTYKVEWTVLDEPIP